ncbi:short chain dehydrogenase family protein [Mycobacterium xenopi 4042]|uniref:Short chain dehydrogenase family protein n=1 Tax=Mycobacterium xenopi 4042 TaxID=1299334 RepID=X7YKC7_MYCXE|nr:short chain dehydrogenase family protein [Mycobacterium xenopi 4042]
MVGLIARRSQRLAAVLADCRRTSSASTMWVADLADTAKVGQLALEVWDTLGGIDVLVNNAAIPKRRVVTALDPPRWRPSCGSTSSRRCALPWRCCLACCPVTPASSSTWPAWAVGSGSSMKPPIAQANSLCAVGANRWQSTCRRPVCRSS